MQERGQPDILGWIPAPRHFKGDTLGTYPVHFAVELKLPGKEADPLQAYQLRRWAEGGYRTGTATTLEEFKEIVFSD